MNKQRAPRLKKRMTCALMHAGRRYSGLVLEISANGLFVQTSAAAEPGDPVQLDVSLPGRGEPVHMDGKTARRRVVPPRLRAVAQGGLGIALVNAPEEYFEFVAELFRTQVAEEKPEVKPRRKSSLERQARQLALRRSLGRCAPGPPGSGDQAEPEEAKAAAGKPRDGGVRRYRVRLKLGLRKQSLEVDASSEEDARRRALAEAGDGWRVLRCEESQ